MVWVKRTIGGIVLVAVIGSWQPQREQVDAAGNDQHRLTLKLKEKLSRPSPLKSAFYVHKSGRAMIAAGAIRRITGARGRR